jgi:hypothetical protein
VASKFLPQFRLINTSFHLQYRVTKIKDLKATIASKFSLDASSMKLLIKGSSTHNDNIRLCDISGLTSPVAVSILSASLTAVNVEDLARKKYEQEVAAIQEGLKEAERNAELRATIANIPERLPEPQPMQRDHFVPRFPLGNGRVELQLPIFSSAFLPSGKPPSDESNQVVFPASVLQQITDAGVEFPVFIEASRITSDGEKRVTHVTPGDYQNRIDAAYAPYQILHNLGLFDKQGSFSSIDPYTSTDVSSSSSMDVDKQNSAHTSSADGSVPSRSSQSSPYPTSGEGALVSFKTVQLPPGLSATIQPLEFDWLTAVPEDQQKAILENQLRQFQCLSLRETFRIKYLHHTFTFKVCSLEPGPGVSLISTDLAVEILPPSEAPTPSNLSHALQLDDLNRDTSKAEVQVVLNLKKGEAHYFTLELTDPNLALLFEIESLEGFPASIFACTRRPYPTATDHIWSSEDFSGLSDRSIKKLQQTGRRRLLLSQDDPQFATGRFNIGVHASLADASCVFKVQLGLKSELAAGHGGSTTGSLLSSSGGFEAPPNTTHCDHCGRWVPSATIVLHQAQCLKRNWRCPSCHFVCPLTEKDKHMSIAHSTVKCECGFESEGDLVALHREYECHLRPFSCPYCNLSMPHGQRASHMKDCGNRTSKCSNCGVWVKHYEMAMHQSQNHPTITEPMDTSPDL